MEVLRDMHLPPGFGFHPSDAELISHYLKRKIHGQRIEYDLIPEVDIYKHEPWDLPSKCNLPIEDNKWHFFASRDRKYPTGARSNRATRAGYWKSTGKDRAIKLNKRTLGTKKTLVFHEGRPPSGKRTEWIMHEYYIDENECQASPDMKDAFVLCRVTRRDDWALENDNGVGNRNPHPQHLNDDATSVVVVEKQEEATSSGICAGVVEKQDGTTASGICAGEPTHVGTPASAELSHGVALTEFMADSPNSESGINAFLEGLLVDPSSNTVYTGSADLSLIEQEVESSNFQNPSSTGPKMEPDHASPIDDEIDFTKYLLDQDIYDILSGLNDGCTSNQANGMMETDHFISPNNYEGTWNREVQLHQGTRNEEVQFHQDNCYISDENADTGITIRRRNITASSANDSPSTHRMKLQVGVKKMVTSNSETINQTFKFEGNSGRMRSFKQSDATRSSENLSNQGNLRGNKSTSRSSARFSILFTCACVIGVIAAVLHGYYSSSITL